MTVYNDEMSRYIIDLFAVEDEALRWAREDSIAQGLPQISIKPEEGRFLQFLVRAANVHRAVELGTLGGYSGIWIGRGLPPQGKLITVEKEPRHAAVADAHFNRAGVADRVEIRQGEAHQVLSILATEGPFDFVFIDADKASYPAYLDWALENVRLGGIIAAHNAFRKGSVIGQGQADEFTPIMKEYNQRVASLSNLITTIFPAGDGMLVSVKTT